ncbi:MAG: hypothetical protein EOO24_22435, partial [Comamonadaceae bacterium]
MSRAVSRQGRAGQAHGARHRRAHGGAAARSGRGGRCVAGHVATGSHPMEVKEARSLLFLPATSTHLLAKAAQRGADALIVDLEDAIPPARKTEARAMAASAVAELAGKLPLLARVNADAHLLRGDLEALPLALLQGVMLPKVESPEQVVALAAAQQVRVGID